MMGNMPRAWPSLESGDFTPLRDGTLTALAILGVVAVVPSAYAVRAAMVGRAPDPRVEREGGTVFLGLWLMEAFHWVIRLVGRALVRTGLSPDALTLTSLVVTLGCIPLAAVGQFGAAAAMLLVGSAFDAFDGMVARERRIASDAGEVLDAVVDRYADAAPLLGLAIFYRGSSWQMAVPIVAMVGSMMVSYTRAKAEAMDVKLPPGLMRRHERIAYLSVALLVGPVLSPFVHVASVPEPVTLAIVAMIGVVSNYAAVQLTKGTRRRLVADGRGPSRMNLNRGGRLEDGRGVE